MITASIAIGFLGTFPARPLHASSFGDVKLPVLAGGEPRAIAPCATERCLTIYVAPWCGYCRHSIPLLKRLPAAVATNRISVRFIVGLASDDFVREFAVQFGGQTMLDPAGKLLLAGGVPNFVLSDSKGNFLKEFAGEPANLESVVQWADEK